jgi:predicted ribosomally synthesized peptide with SipW-like signal peptide
MRRYNNRRKGRGLAQVSIVCLVLVMALGLTGVSYAAWTDTATILGQMETGTVDADLSLHTGYEIGGTPSKENLETTVLMKLELDTIDYPVYNQADPDHYLCYFDIQNTGSIPVKISDYYTEVTIVFGETQITVVTPADDGVSLFGATGGETGWATLPAMIGGYITEEELVDPGEDYSAYLSIDLSEINLGDQIDPGDTYPVSPFYGILDISLINNPPYPIETLDVTLYVEVVQWNLYTGP